MNEDLKELAARSLEDTQAANELLSKIFELTSPDAIYGQPVTQGEYTVITASELVAGVGAGYGGGGGIPSEQGAEGGPGAGYGGGGGGGGGSIGRPVAAISIGPDGVRVEPIVDVTKVAIAFFTAFGAMWMALSRMRRAGR